MFNVKDTEHPSAIQLIAAIKADKALEVISPLIQMVNLASKDLNIDLLNIQYTSFLNSTESILYTAALKGRLDLIPVLLEAGADPAQGSCNAATALNAIMPTRYSKTQTASEEKILLIAKLLVEKAPAILERYSQGYGSTRKTPIHDVIEHQKWKLAAYFIEKGAHLYQKDSDSQTAHEKLSKSIERDACPEEVRDLIKKSYGCSV